MVARRRRARRSAVAGRRRRFTRRSNAKLVNFRQLKHWTRLNRNPDVIGGTADLANATGFDAPAIISLTTNMTSRAPPFMFDFERVETRFVFKAQAAAGATFTRVVIFQWFEDDTEESPVSSDILVDDTEPHVSPIVSTYGARNRFKVLRDFRVKLGENTSLDGADQSMAHVKIFKKSLRKFKFTVPGGAQTGMGHVYMLASSNVLASSSPPTVDLHCEFGGIVEDHSRMP